MTAIYPKATLDIQVSFADSHRLKAVQMGSVVLLCLSLFGCGSKSDIEGVVIEGSLPPDSSTDQLQFLEEYLADKELPPGEWRDENGARVCDGYMTRFADQDYCAAEVPEDWVLFEFNGEDLYIQPLTDSDDRR